MCLRSVAAQIVEVEGRVWLAQDCPHHGEARSLIASNAAEYQRLRQYVPARVSGSCCGGDTSCATESPTCVLLVEITQACNLRCPTCYADAHGHDFMPITEIERRLQLFFESHSHLDVLMLSGGEPTIHPQFEQILECVLKFPVGRVFVNTNGLRLVQSKSVLDAIAARKNQVELYLSFSSFRKSVHERLYAKDLRREKAEALACASSRGILTTLVVTVEAGVNEDEIGDILQFALENDCVNGITFQPAMTAGRYENGDQPASRATLTSVLACLEDQTHGMLKSTDFVGLPCSHPDCAAITYILLDETRTTMTPLPRHLDVARYMDMVSDRISFAGIAGAAARRVWSDTVHLKSLRTLKDLAILFKEAGIREILPLIGKPEIMSRRVFRIVVKPFMDAKTFDQRRVDQCCTKILLDSGETLSFCEFNIFHRNRRITSGLQTLTMHNDSKASV